jgi:aspartyl-tRNA(Asn)/glutamyl-tRNA(Gln) amidotransferase subunit C
MTITPDTVEHVAKLARLELTPDEVQRYTKDLANILSLVEQLNAVDLSQIELEMDVKEAAVLREDKANREFTRDELMANAPDVEDGFFRVPKILGDNAS